MVKMRDILIEAEEALMAGDYAKTLELLRPFEDNLAGGKRRALWELVMNLASQQDKEGK